jgi:hypothetical protein
MKDNHQIEEHETYPRPTKHMISILFENGQKLELESTSSGLTELPYRLWVELPGGQRSYFMMERIVSYTIG